MTEDTLYKELCDDFLPVFRKLAGTEVYSITLSGSRGKGAADLNSDFDFGVFYEEPAKREVRRLAYEEINRLVSKWKQKNVLVDGPWARTYAEVDEKLDLWLTGKGEPEPYVWTIWGYNLLTEINNMQVVEDPYGRVSQWKERLSTYPEALKNSIIKKHSASLEYWRNDYHYLNKVRRKDVVFLASLNARLIQDIVQIIYALNAYYYPGDGMNLKYSEQFECKPERFEERVTDILQTTGSDDAYEVQYKKMIGLIDDVLALVRG